MTEKLVMAVIIAAACFAANRQRALSPSGAVMAFAVGSAVYYGLGGKGLTLLVVFFITSSIWSKFKRANKAKLEDKLEKGSVRDWRQVLANGGIAAILALIYSFSNQQIWIAAFAVAISSANSDTWASEIGSLSKKNPIDIRTLRRVEKGTSGAISLLGTFAALLGSFLIAFFSSLFFEFNLFITILICAFGFIGNIIDTLFGAFYQLKYYCQACKIETEKKVHCGKKTMQIKGYRYIDNDMVNFLSGFVAVLIALCVFLVH